MPPHSIKGLTNFVADVRACPSRDLEEKRVTKELVKIKSRLSASKNVSGYEKKKCVWKLVYCYMLGYEVPFGQIEAINLISSLKYSEKAAGYIASSLLLSDQDDILRLSINLVKIDMLCSNEYIAALALNFVANVGTLEMTEMLFNDIQRVSNPANGVRPYLRRRGYLAMLRCFRKRPEMLPAQIWVGRIIQMIISEKDVGALTSLCSLIIGVLETSTEQWESIVPHVVQLWSRISSGDVPQFAIYNSIPAPWLQMKVLRILQFFPPPINNPGLIKSISENLQRILATPPIPARLPPHGQTNKRRVKADQEKSNRVNTEHAILFESVNLVLHYDNGLDPSIKKLVASILGNLVALREANIRYLSLEAMARLAMDPDVVKPLKKQVKLILAQLSEPDNSLQKQALNLLFSICDNDNWQQIVDELLESLAGASKSLQEELVLRIAILVEKNAPDFTWYVDVVFKMIEYAPESVSDDVWFRLVQVVTGIESEDEKLQTYAATKAYDYLADHYSDETMVRLGSYLLGEFGHLIRDEASGSQQLSVLHRHFRQVNPPTQAILLTAYVKLVNAHEEILDKVLTIFEDNCESSDVEVQQRATEFLALCSLDPQLLETSVAMMPAYPLQTLKESSLFRRLKGGVGSKASNRHLLEELAQTDGALLKPSVNRPPSINDSTSSSEGKEEQEESEDEEEEEESKSNEKSEAGSSESSESDSKSESSESEDDNVGEELKLKVFPAPKSNDAKGLWKSLCLSREGDLFSNPFLRVYLRHQYKGSIGRILIEFQNTSADSPIQIDRINIQQQPSLIATIRTPVPPNFLLAPKSNSRQAIEVMCVEPANVVIGYSLQLVTGANTQPFSVPLFLPVVITKFITPLQIPPSTFRDRWKELEDSTSTTTVTNFNCTSKESKKMMKLYVSEGLNFSTEQAGESLLCSGTFSCSPNMKDTQSAIILMRLLFAPNGSKLQASVKSRHPQLLKSVTLLLCSILKPPFLSL